MNSSLEYTSNQPSKELKGTVEKNPTLADALLGLDTIVKHLNDVYHTSLSLKYSVFPGGDAKEHPELVENCLDGLSLPELFFRKMDEIETLVHKTEENMQLTKRLIG